MITMKVQARSAIFWWSTAAASSAAVTSSFKYEKQQELRDQGRHLFHLFHNPCIQVHHVEGDRNECDSDRQRGTASCRSTICVKDRVLHKKSCQPIFALTHLNPKQVSINVGDPQFELEPDCAQKTKMHSLARMQHDLFFLQRPEGQTASQQSYNTSCYSGIWSQCSTRQSLCIEYQFTQYPRPS